jgi:hypothetical protein
MAQPVGAAIDTRRALVLDERLEVRRILDLRAAVPAARAAAARRLGLERLHYINATGRLPGFAAGGAVGAGIPAPTATEVGVQVSPQVVIASNDVVQALAKDADFARLVTRVVISNGRAISRAGAFA